MLLFKCRNVGETPIASVPVAWSFAGLEISGLGCCYWRDSRRQSDPTMLKYFNASTSRNRGMGDAFK